MDPRRTVPEVVLDPDLPASVAGTLRSSPAILRAVRAGAVPPPSGPTPGMVLVVTSFLLVALMVTGPWGMVAIGAVVAAFGGTQALAGDPKRRDARRRLRLAAAHAGRFILPEDLDAGCRELLARAQSAVAGVLGSQVNGAGLLDAIDNSVTLPAEVWRLAQRLADLTRTRAEHDRIVPRDVPDDIAGVFSPYDDALDRARRSLTSRVTTLEEYAREVRRADAVYRAYRQLGVLRERTPDYERLLAATAEDRLAVPHIDRLGLQAKDVERVFHASIDEARRAGGHLLSLAAA
ncbi:hypothetical protein [Sphaerisporangium corydalis]|uniref:5-bromo-4-chloroindolyl phosphate hydrolysis protein n=1 Tax=Sphaerisporangium corydalis TaxID=1441875 RepID=A0ABV9EER6_9ACTN|nr:hypothetical protein [Sphaerisporangium corydalis]